MERKDRELMERYIYAVVRRLPKEQRDEVALELTELIEDMAEEETMGEVLRKLGDPAAFARKYRGDNNCLIGPDYYDNYQWVLKIVMACVLASALISGLAEGIVEGRWTLDVVGSIIENTTRMIIHMIVNAVTSSIMAVGAVTLVFAVMERMQIKAELRKEKEWSVEQLKDDPAPQKEKAAWNPERLEPVPDKKALISRADSVASIVFAAIFCGLLIFAPHLLGIYLFDENQKLVQIIPLFNLEKWNLILPFLLASLLIGFVDDLIKLIKGCYSSLVLVSGIITSVLELGLLVVALKLLPFWNPQLMADMEKYVGLRFTAKGDIFSYFGTEAFSNIILMIALLAVSLELINTIYKTVRYGME